MPVETLTAVDSFRATESGFTCTRADQSREFQDDDVIGLRVRKQRVPSPEGASRIRESLAIRVLDQSFPIVEVDADYAGSHDNFLAPFRNRLLDSLTERAAAALVRDDQFDGGPWTIGLEGLTDKRTGTRTALENISGVAWRDCRLCIWKLGSDEVAVSFAADEENTYLLARLTSKLLQLDAGEQDGPYGEPSRDVYEFRDTSFPAQIAMGVIGGAGFALVIGVVKLALGGQPLFFAAAGISALATLAALGLVYWQFGTPSILRLSDSALTLVRRARETILPLSDVAEFSAEWTDYHRDGVYQQTRVRFHFTSDEPSVPALTYDAQASYGAPKFDELQQFQALVAAAIARRLADELKSAGRVSWTARLVLLPKGFEFTKKAGEEPRLIAFSQITTWEVDQGLLKVAIDGGSKPYIVEKTNQPNFYPGLVLFKQCVAAR